MPGYRGHLAGGAIAYGITVYLLQSLHPSAITLIEWLGFALIGSLFPDVDTKSKGQKLFYSVFGITCIGLAIEGKFKIISGLAILGILPLLVHHRGLFHRIWFVIGLPLFIVWLGSLWAPALTRSMLFDALFFIVGAISHLWLDLGLRRMLRF
ncbi:MAG TPA: metal-dependent hydrolase [Candidatus Babeliales bacterium]|nr:metal-dependent hydrolase [Candidatus Babeliales bacterium]